MLGFERAIWISRRPRRIQYWWSGCFAILKFSYLIFRRKHISFVELVTVMRITSPSFERLLCPGPWRLLGHLQWAVIRTLNFDSVFPDFNILFRLILVVKKTQCLERARIFSANNDKIIMSITVLINNGSIKSVRAYRSGYLWDFRHFFFEKLQIRHPTGDETRLIMVGQ